MAGIVLYLAFGVIYAARSSATLSTPLGDGQYYEIMARQILTDHVYGYKSDRPNAYVTPGYPLFLAAVYGVTGHAEEGRPWPVLVALQLLFGAGAIALVYVLGSDLAGERAGAIAAFLFALYPPGFLIAPLWLTEPLGTVALLGYVVLQLRALERRSVPLALAAGAVLALAVLTRPAVLPVAVVPFALRAAFGPREGLVRQAALALAAWALVMSPWVVRNVVVLHRPAVLSTHSGDPMLGGVDPYYWEMGRAYRYHGPTYKQYLEEAPKDVSKDEYARKAIARHLREKPLQTVWWFTIGKFGRMYFGEVFAGRPKYIGTWTTIVHMTIVVLGFAGALLSVRMKRLRDLALMVALGTAALLPFVPESRFVYGYTPLLAVMGAAVVVRAWTQQGEDAAGA